MTARSASGGSQKNNSLTYMIAAYLITGTAFVVFSFFPEGHVWGFNLLAFFPPAVRYISIPVILVIPLVVVTLVRRRGTGKATDSPEGTRQFLLFALAITVISAVLFYFFRTITHFDGDGYISLSNLYGGAAVVRAHNYIPVKLKLALYAWFGKGGESTALLVYQLVSYGAGVLFLITSAIAAVIQFKTLRNRLLFFLGMAVGGYSMQFFGYVENYSLFLASIAIYLLAGMLILNGSWPRWVIVIANGFVVLMHIFGLLLLPATLYILVRKTRLAGWWEERTVLVKASAVLACLIVGLGFYLYLSRVSYFFRFAFLPLFANQFTATGYTIFSPGHLLDIVNLLFLLCPGLLILIVGIPKRRGSSTDMSLSIFLGLAVLGSFLAILLIDPKLSMPRDWDLFAFLGVSLNMFLLVLALGRKGRNGVVGVSLAVITGAMFLSSAVATRTHDQVAIARLRNTIKLDPVRNRNSGYFIGLYYSQKGDAARGEAEQKAWKATLVDDSLSVGAFSRLQSDNPESGVAACRQILKINPWFSGAYNALGGYFIRTGQLDSAREYLRTAIGLQSGFGIYWNSLGWVEMKLGNDREAERCWRKSADLDTTLADPLLYLLDLYHRQGREKDFYKCLIEVGGRPGVPNSTLYQLAWYYCQQSQWGKARGVFYRMVANKLDSAHYQQIVTQYPQLLGGKEPEEGDSAVGK